MEISAFGTSRQGAGNPHNEDRFLIVNNDNDLNLFIVCDGMGGHSSGEIAAAMACASVSDYIQRHRQVLEQNAPFGSGRNAGVRSLVQQAILKACQDIYQRAREDINCSGMGTTISLVLIHKRRAIIGHVGDCRIYLARKGGLDQLSHDHTLIQELIDKGVVAPDQCYQSPYSHVLSRALGVQESVEVDILQLDLLPEDRLLICSDGASDSLKDPSRLATLLADSADKIPDKIANEAASLGAQDDISVILIDIKRSADESAEEKRRIEEVTLTMDVLKQVYLFQDLATNELAQVVERCMVVTCPAGEVIMREGQFSNSLYIILDGFLRISRGAKSLTGLGKGNHVGEMALFLKSPRTADVIALADAKLLQLKSDDFFSLVNENPKLGIKLLSAIAQELSSRLKQTNMMLEAY